MHYRGHTYEIPECCTNLHKKSFITQSLYLYIDFFTFVSCLLTATLHVIDVRLTCRINITYLHTFLLQLWLFSCDCLASSAPFTNIQTYLLTYLLTYIYYT